MNLKREPGNKATCSCTHSVHVHYSYMYLALIYQAHICTCISICNLVCMSSVMFMLIISHHKYEEIVYMQNLHMITFRPSEESICRSKKPNRSS